MKYESFSFENKAEIEERLKSTSSEVLIETIVGMVEGVNDWQWLQDKLLQFIQHKDFWVAKNAVTGLGDVARTHGQLDLKKVRNRLALVKRKDLLGPIEDTLEDLEQFL